MKRKQNPKRQCSLPKKTLEDFFSSYEYKENQGDQEPKKLTSRSKSNTPPPESPKILEFLSEKRLERNFFTQEVVELSKALLGKIIVRNIKEGQMRFKIVETEAYKGPLDKACHAYDNKRTERTKYFWRIGGCLYIFMIYGKNCFNITAGTADDPEAVLIRALEPCGNLRVIKSIRKCKNPKDIANGPGKCGDALCLDRSYNGYDLCQGEEMYIVDNKEKFEICISKRINIDYAGEWKDKLWRFYIKNNSFVSKPANRKKK